MDQLTGVVRRSSAHETAMTQAGVMIASFGPARLRRDLNGTDRRCWRSRRWTVQSEKRQAHGLDVKVHIHQYFCMEPSIDGLKNTLVIQEIGATCVLMRTRLIARVVTALHDEALRRFGIGAAQFVLLAVIGKLQPASRADIGRFHRQDRSTLSRNLKVIIAAGWAEEDPTCVQGRARPVILTHVGKGLLIEATPSWREAQAEAKTLLGPTGTKVVTAIANEILNQPIRS